MTTLHLDSVLAPASVAVVGASDNPRSFGGRLWRYLTRDFQGPAFAVNPRLPSIDGMPCVASLEDLEESVDSVVFATPADATLRMLADAGSVGAKAAVLFSRDLLGRESEISAIAERSGITALGPNCLGLINANAGILLSSSVSLERPSPPGPFALVSQSGAIMGLLHARSLDLGIRLGLAVSTGSQAMVRVEDCLIELARRGESRAVAVYLEDLDPEGFATAVGHLTAEHIAVVVLKGGASDLGRQTAATHSRALASDDRTFRLLVRELGAIPVGDPGQILPALAAAVTKGRRWQIVTSSGGLAAIAADRATSAGLELPAPDDRQAAPGSARGNPADLDAGSSSTQQKMDLIQALAADARFDGVLVVLNDAPDLADLVSSLRALVGDGLGRILVVAECSGQFAALWQDWVDSGAAVLPGLVHAVDALALAHPVGPRQERAREAAADLVPPMELQALLLEAGLPLAAAEEVESAEAARAAASRIGYPVVCKVSRVPHRGSPGVRTDLASAAEVEAAYGALAAAGPVLVQQQCAPGLEFYVGVRADPTFGPLVIVGTGGNEVEALDDVAVGRLPLSNEALDRLAGSTRTGRWLAARSSRGLVDLGRLGEIAATAARVLAGGTPPLASLDLNPVVVHASGATVVDAKAVRASPLSSSRSTPQHEESVA